MTEEVRPRTAALLGNSADTFGHGFDVFIETLIADIGSGRFPFEEMDVSGRGSADSEPRLPTRRGPRCKAA